MGFLKKLFGADSDDKEAHVEVVTKDDSQAVFGYVTDVPGKGLSLEEAHLIQTQALAELASTDSVDEKINTGAKLMTAGNFQASVEVYNQIAQDHPEESATCQGQIGAAEYFMGNYHQAITHYETAKQLGADAVMMDQNIEEAREALQ